MEAPDCVDLLRTGTIELLGRLRWSSNATFLVSVEHDDGSLRAIYKPTRGERPLWDFPPGLGAREVAAWLLSDSLGWGLVPPTVLRDGPFGEGSLQLFVDHDPEMHYFPMIAACDQHVDDQLRAVCCFDLLVNNTDRKSGHCLLDAAGHVWAIDHGLTYHADPKLRTVIWDFSGDPIPRPLLADIADLLDRGTPAELRHLLTDEEHAAFVERARSVLDRGTFPSDPTGHAYPWPLV